MLFICIFIYILKDKWGTIIIANSIEFIQSQTWKMELKWINLGKDYYSFGHVKALRYLFLVTN